MEGQDSIVAAIKKYLLPELDAIKNSHARVETRLDAIEKRLSDINAHLIKRIDGANARIDQLRSQPKIISYFSR